MRITSNTVARIKNLSSHGLASVEIARQTGVSSSAVRKARQGSYDDRLKETGDEVRQPAKRITWCQRCRCHCEGPCKLCAMRRGDKQLPPKPRPPIPAGITDIKTLRKLNTPVSELAISVRTANRLELRNILTVNDVLHCTRAELLEIPHVGPYMLEEILAALAQLGFHRRSKSEPQEAA